MTENILDTNICIYIMKIKPGAVFNPVKLAKNMVVIPHTGGEELDYIHQVIETKQYAVYQ
tara:strand:- start:126 stop:305 length:180 start_codon:yes stop_codon:yes gene_type:complete